MTAKKTQVKKEKQPPKRSFLRVMGVMSGLIGAFAVILGILVHMQTVDKGPTKAMVGGSKFDVDLVYLWCDGDEPAFATRKNEWLAKEGKKLPKTAIDKGRFVQVDELKYSLRSVEKYVPWVRHIYIVTDRQVPTWLNTKHPKITVVDHSKIIPKKYIPTFNSNGIQAAIYKIPGLSEHFLLADDDMFFNRPIDQKFFFPEPGRVNIRFRKRKSVLGKAQYYQMILNALNLLERDFGDLRAFAGKDYEPHHNVDAYLKSDYRACVQQYRKEYEETLSHRFREKSDVQRAIVSVYSYLKDHARLVTVNEKPYSTPEGRDSWFFMNPGWKKYGKIINQVHPALFCLNDTANSTEEMREETRLFLEKHFPNKSQFEK